MGYPQRLLDADEKIVLDLHPHWRRIVVPVTLVPIVVGVAVYGLVEADQSWERYAIGIVALIVVLVFSLWPFLKWWTTQYVVTNRRIAVRRGVLSREGRDVPLTRVNDVTFQHTVIERIFRSGTLTIESAGERGQVVLGDTPRVEEVQRTIYRLVEDEGARSRTVMIDDDGDGRGDRSAHPST
jgi:uncharacterized membrane protein YdbT with pleckstrin-like domain